MSPSVHPTVHVPVAGRHRILNKKLEHNLPYLIYEIQERHFGKKHTGKVTKNIPGILAFFAFCSESNHSAGV